MTNDQRSLRALITQDMYVVDERLIAAAILARANAHATVARASFHSDPRASVVRVLRRGMRARATRRLRSVRLRPVRLDPSA